MVEIQKYTESSKKIWDRFVLDSRNGTFLFARDYMDYHKDRFDDESLMFFKNKSLIAIFPANRYGDELCSHCGLTYGGLVINHLVDTATMLSIFDALLKYCTDNKITKVRYKAMPYIYHKQPANEDQYALFRVNAKLVRRDASSTILLGNNFSYPGKRNRGAMRAERDGLIVKETSDLDAFIAMVNARLDEKYSATAVHTKEEMELLKNRFKKNIRLFGVYDDDAMVAGGLVYETDTVAHMQYMTTNDVGRKKRALDLLLKFLLVDVYAEKRFFDFGISTENNGQYLNETLVKQKEEFGATCVCYDTYEIICV